MAVTLATMNILSVKCLSINSQNLGTWKSTIKSTSLLSHQNLYKSITISNTCAKPNASTSITGTAIAGAIFSTLASCDPALAAQQLSEIADGDSRVLAVLLPIIPAILWVLYNILGPALNQINRMRSEKGIVIGLGLGGLLVSSFFAVPSASASEIVVIGEASSDNRGLLLLVVVTPALLWVLYNILQPALNQINRMRS